MTTIKQQLFQAMQSVKETPKDLVAIFYHPIKRVDDPKYPYLTRDTTIIPSTFDDLPDREFDSGFGGVDGEHLIAFSKRYVYVKGQYDGSEWIEAVPRNPKDVSFIPCIGG